jgi:hypothetical protein
MFKRKSDLRTKLERGESPDPSSTTDSNPLSFPGNESDPGCEGADESTSRHSKLSSGAVYITGRKVLVNRKTRRDKKK